MISEISIVIGTFGKVPKSLERGLKELETKGLIETIQTTALLKSVRKLGKLKETSYHSDTSERPSCNAGVENLQKI